MINFCTNAEAMQVLLARIHLNAIQESIRMYPEVSVREAYYKSLRDGFKNALAEMAEWERVMMGGAR